jgi:hypothetical protein
MNLDRVPLIATDGFEFYKRVVRRILGPACLYGQVIKIRRNDRIIKVERRMLIGDAWRLSPEPGTINLDMHVCLHKPMLTNARVPRGAVRRELQFRPSRYGMKFKTSGSGPRASSIGHSNGCPAP